MFTCIKKHPLLNATLVTILSSTLCGTLHGQSSLVLNSGSGAPGTVMPMSLTIASTPGNQPAAIEWTIGYSTAVASLSVVAGPALIAANKTLTCSAGTGAYTCIAVGQSSSAIADGIAATVLVSLAPNVPLATLTLSNGVGATLDASDIPMSVTGGIAQTIVSVISVNCSQSSLTSTSTSICTVNLNGPAGAGGAVVGVSSSTADLTAPPSLLIPVSSSTGTFVATAGNIGSNESATITTSLNGVTTTTISLVPILVTGLQCGTGTLASSASTLCSVTISKPAPIAGTGILLTDNAPTQLTVPSTVTVPANSTSAVFSASTGPLSGSTPVNLSAAIGSSSATFALTAAGGPVSVFCNPMPMSPGQSGTCTVSMAGPGSVAKLVNLSSNNGGFSVPAAITVPSGAASATFPYTAMLTLSGSPVLSATAENVTATLAAIVQPDVRPPSVSLAAPANSSILSGLITVNASATDNVGVAAVQITLDGASVGGLQNVTGPSYTYTWNTQETANGAHVLGLVASDAAGNTATTKISITVENAPTFSGVTITGHTSSSVTISWITNEASNSQVAYGPTAAYGSLSGINPAMVTSHCVTLNGLLASTTYHYEAQSVDAAGNPGTSTDFTFTTDSALQTLLQMHLNSTEVSAVTKGSVVTPTNGPAGFTGTVVVNGTGSVNFTPAQSGDGVYFQNCCANTNNAYYKFTGATVGNVFDVSQGQVTFFLTSRYSFAQRQASAWQPRYTFDVRDGNGNELFCFITQVVSGKLVFNYLAAGAGSYYFVPSGTEDATFGNGVTLQVSITWGATGANLYLNNTLVKSTSMTTPAPSWTASSVFNFGAMQYLTFGGYNSVDDIVDEFTVLGEANGPGRQLSANVRISAAQRPYQGVLAASTAPGTGSSDTRAMDPAKPTTLSCPEASRAVQSVICEVGLDRTVSENPAAISLMSDSDSVQVPTSVLARSGQRRIRFALTVSGGTSQTAAHITAKAGNAAVQTALTIGPPPTRELTGANTKNDKGQSLHSSSPDLQSSPEVALRGPGRPAIVTLENGANRVATAACSPGSLATLSGHDLYTGELPAWNYSGKATELKGTRVLVNDIPTPVLYASSDEVSFVCPDLSPGTPLQIAVETPAGMSSAINSQMLDVAPGLFTVDYSETREAVVAAADSGALSQIPGFQEPGSPVLPETAVTVTATGFPCNETFIKRLFVKVEEQYVAVESVRKADQYAGACEIAIHVPTLSGDALPIVIEATRDDGGIIQSNVATFAIARYE